LATTKVEEEGKNNMSSKQLKGITPTFQQVLNKEIAKIMDAIDEGNVEQAYVCLKTLIGSLRLEDRDKLKKEMLAPIDAQLSKVGHSEAIDYYTGLLQASKQQENILYRNIRPLYEAVMGTLHEGGYLEVYRQFVDGTAIGHSKS